MRRDRQTEFDRRSGGWKRSGSERIVQNHHLHYDGNDDDDDQEKSTRSGDGDTTTPPPDVMRVMLGGLRAGKLSKLNPLKLLIHIQKPARKEKKQKEHLFSLSLSLS